MKRYLLTGSIAVLGVCVAGPADSGTRQSTAGGSHPPRTRYSLRVVAGNRDTLGRAFGKRLPLLLSALEEAGPRYCSAALGDRELGFRIEEVQTPGVDRNA